MEKEYMKNPVIQKIASAAQIGWINDKLTKWSLAKENLPVEAWEITDAEERLRRFGAGRKV